MKEYKVGDSVWHASCGTKQIEKLCPICFGKKQVKLILGNDDEVTLPCNYCRLGLGSPRGRVTEHEYIAKPEQVVITEIEMKVTASAIERKYWSGCYLFDESDIFDSEGEALARCLEVVAKKQKEESTRAEYIKKDRQKSFSWNAGYHLREAAKARKDAEYHERNAVLCKSRTKEG